MAAESGDPRTLFGIGPPGGVCSMKCWCRLAWRLVQESLAHFVLTQAGRRQAAGPNIWRWSLLLLVSLHSDGTEFVSSCFRCQLVQRYSLSCPRPSGGFVLILGGFAFVWGWTGAPRIQPRPGGVGGMANVRGDIGTDG